MARILIIDEDEHLCTLYQMELAEEGHEVMVAHDWASAAGLAVRHQPDLVMIEPELHCPRVDLQRMFGGEAGCPRVPVVINTGYYCAAWVGVGRRADAWVLKSANLDPLKAAIRGVLGRTGRRTQARIGGRDD